MTTGASTPTAPRRSRARTFLPLAVAAWLVLEIWLLTVVGGQIGGLGVFALLAGAAALGVVVIKRAGRRAFRNLTETFQQAQAQAQSGGVPPAAPAAGGGSGNGLTMLAGLLLIMPGLLSDALGLLLLVPPVRSLVTRRAGRLLERQVVAAAPGGFGQAYQQARIHFPDGKVVQGEVIREDRPAGPSQSPGQSRSQDPARPPLTP
ncbi:FxsA family protein [Streptomyces bambusae]|uniref:FxsA family membrane protein n=1 Tax=Streptomyces bambusae TaxID=1550616 RepID=UPI001CFE9AAC|nr:FxsA family membrane protein [Streptomyces bambusae]MCB5165248.1 FxsA family protein [Streptomyces bambusae]